MQITRENMLNKEDLLKVSVELEKDQPLEDQVRELVSIAASVAGHCRPCFQYHLKKARELGIPASEIEKVIAIAKEISASGNKNMVEFAVKSLKTYDNKGKDNG